MRIYRAGKTAEYQMKTDGKFQKNVSRIIFSVLLFP